VPPGSIAQVNRRTPHRRRHLLRPPPVRFYGFAREAPAARGRCFLPMAKRFLWPGRAT
jgi:hypothetical protein